jgi:hypothetical protein
MRRGILPTATQQADARGPAVTVRRKLAYRGLIQPAIAALVVAGCSWGLGIRPASAATGFSPADCNQTRKAIASAAGADFVINPPSGHVYELVALQLKFVTSATVATRTVTVQIATLGAFEYLVTGLTQAASLTNTFQGVQGAGVGSSGTTVILPLPLGVTFDNGYNLQSVTTNIQTGDQWSGSAIVCDVTNVTQHVAHIDNWPVTQAISGSVSISGTPSITGNVNANITGGTVAGTFTSTDCPGIPSTTTSTAAPTTTTTGTASTTTTLPNETACPVRLASFSGDGLTVPVGAGLIAFAAMAMLVMGFRHRRSY